MYCGWMELFADDGGENEGDGGAKCENEFTGLWQTKTEISNDPSRMGGLEVRKVRYWVEGGKEFMVLRPVNDMVLEVRRLPECRTMPGRS